MKSWGIIRYKHLFSSEADSKAISPVVGSILMLMILVLLVGVVTITSFNIVGEGKSFQPLMARISIESCEGGLSPNNYILRDDTMRARFQENRIVLMHEGGDFLPLDSNSILIFGYGNCYRPVFGQGFLTGNVSIIYLDLSSEGKNSKYMSLNKETLKDNFWSVGEKLILHGNDSATGSTVSSVKASVDGDSNTSDNYGFKVGSEIILKVIDVKNRNVIAEQKAIVKHYEK